MEYCPFCNPVNLNVPFASVVAVGSPPDVHPSSSHTDAVAITSPATAGRVASPRNTLPEMLPTGSSLGLIPITGVEPTVTYLARVIDVVPCQNCDWKSREDGTK